METLTILIMGQKSDDFIRLLSEHPPMRTERDPAAGDAPDINLVFGRFAVDKGVDFHLLGTGAGMSIDMVLSPYLDYAKGVKHLGYAFLADGDSERATRELAWCRRYLSHLPYVLAEVNVQPLDVKTAQAIIIALLEQSEEGRAILKTYHVFGYGKDA